MNPRWTDEDVEKLIRLLNQGWQLNLIAQALHRCPSDVVAEVKRLQIRIPSDWPHIEAERAA
jgi:IS30 family transposase